GYAQYNWAGTSTAGNYEAVLTVTISATVIKTEHFRVTVKAKPPAFTILLTTDIGKVRFEIGDDVEGSGVLPDGSNFSDAQVQHALDVSGGVYAAVAHLCRSLAARWTIVPDKVITDSGALSIDRTQQVKHWRDMASEYTRKAAGGGGLVSLALDRRDAWSVSDEVGGDELLREEDTTYSD
ncbi:MAG TPA: hypothetical protein VJ754_05205, partial [Anaerolineae bacterium]|nr:hypothetical protein [Anaerolineae bacterium]